MSEYTIVLPETALVARICGTNDSNLKLIEENLGVTVFCTGNELSIETEDPEIQQKFKFILDRITDEISENPSWDEDLVHSILNTSFTSQNGGQGFDASRFAISIPGGIKKVYPKTVNQAKLVEAFRTNDLVFAEGPAGSGKTFLAVAESVRLLMSHRVNKIILTRPVVEAGENLGFLPGDLQDKISPYLRPLYDAMNVCAGSSIVRKMQDNDIIEIAPLAYMRGRTLDNAAVILDEAQNTTREQMKMFLTRMGENTKMFITGDESQTDLRRGVPSGLAHALQLLQGIPEISIVHLDGSDVVRSALVKKIVQAYENGKE